MKSMQTETTQTRREVLQSGATLAGALAVGVVGYTTRDAAAYEPAKVVPRQIIDTHTHFFDPTRRQGVPWPDKDSPLYRRTLPGDYQKLAGPLGVTGTVVVEASPLLEDNQWILDLARDEPLIVGFVGHLTPGGDNFAANLKRLAKNRLFRGIRIRGNDLEKAEGAEAVRDDLRRLADADLTLDILRPNKLSTVEDLARRIPALRIVVNHFPRDIPEAFGPGGGTALESLAARTNVYAKVSNVLRKQDDKLRTEPAAYRAELDLLWKHFGDDRVLYGSNWPVCERVAPYSEVQKVVQDYVSARGQAATDKYFWQNAQAAYKWVDRSEG